jgi:hypothetical protein
LGGFLQALSSRFGLNLRNESEVSKMTNSKNFAMAAVAFAGWMVMVLPAHAQLAPFAGLSGSWTGSGKVALSDGSNERLRCRAAYRVDPSGVRLQQTLKCASDSYMFDLTSEVLSEGSRISGTWSEASRNVSGTLQGRLTGESINLVADTVGFSANLHLTTRGNRQNVSIESQGDIRSVSITMTRS